MTIDIILKSPEDVKLLNDIAFDYGDKMLITETADYIDARSILALFSLINRPVKVVFPDHCNIEKMNKIIKRLAVLM